MPLAHGVTVNGRFAVIAVDGSLGEWQGGDVFYNDSEIGDGLPLNSTYASISLANDASTLYMGLQLKAASSIYSNWTHEIYIDTDNNPATGFNSGWMSGGYDRLIQYGSGGGVYSVYSFSGGGNQAAWSWNFVDIIGFSYNQDVIEWSIPRTALDGTVTPRILFHVGGGDVSVETWGSSAEVNAKNYQIAATPNFNLQIHSGPGTATPAAGLHVNAYGTEVANSISVPSAANGTQLVSLGWAMSGNNPVSGNGTSFNMTATNNAVLNWLWQTNVYFSRASAVHGSVGTYPADGYYERSSSVTVTASPNSGYVFAGWSGDVPGGQTNDNPVTVTLDRTRSITANYAVDYGRFTPIALDGSLVDWQPGDIFYNDAEISDGSPDNSTYSEVYVANDQTYLYVGLQLKADSTIFSNWTHTLYIDTDNNPATGFNAGWMSGGYDRLVQYGSGGGTYSVYTFSGTGQASWSWDFTAEINYAFNGNVIEWAIPRSALGGSAVARLEFQTGSGGVTVETWANASEAQAKVYTFSLTPSYTVNVANAFGSAVPAVGAHAYDYGTALSAHVTEPAAALGTQYVCTGWTMPGLSPVSGSTTGLTATVTNSATLTWLWQTNVQLTLTTTGAGALTGDCSGYYQAGSTVNITPVPDAGYVFAGWSGDVPGGQTNDSPLALTMSRSRAITANFAIDYGRFATISMDGNLSDWVAGDLFYNDSEIGDGSPANSTYSGISVANDIGYLYIGIQLKGASSISSNWTHELYIDTDNNPATGFNAGWMSGGYDRLVQYGSGGTVYSIYSFAGGTQAEWSWNFLGTINYAFNGDVIEWAIPRSELAGAETPRLEFRVTGGDVSVETWAEQTEASAKFYTMAPTPLQTLQIASARGTSSPSVGAHTNNYGTSLDVSAISPAPANGTQYVASGWAMSGQDPVSGSGTNFSMTVTNNAVLTWLWTTNVLFTRTAGSNGAITGDAGTYHAINGVVNATAIPDGGYLFKGWSGDVPGGQTNDNPLALTLDRARSITANFGTHQGIYDTPVFDGVLTDWSGVGAFYSDSDISDGLPLNSSCSSIFVMNDLANLYVGLQFKAATSINSNWVYNLFIDTDMNPATGFNGNGNWMANGYDRLIQYGANGGVYSVYSFSGGTQGDWSWNFVSLINYAHSGSTAEWGIPLSSLGLSGTDCKLLFQATDGSVAVETWAPATEADARIYTLGTPPPQTLQVSSLYGTASPAVGTHTNAYGTEVNALVVDPSASAGTQFVAVAWIMTGNDPVSGTGNSFTMTHTNTAVLTWLWNTNVLFARSADVNGSISGDAAGYYAINSVVSITAVPNGGYSFAGWTGDVPGGQEAENPLNLTLDRARSIVATFSQNVGRFENVTMDGSLAEWQGGDVFYNDSEIGDGLPLNSTYSSISVVNDDDYLYAGMQLKAGSAITSNWVHELYIDTDMNPATGFNAGWMSGGYDRLVQYGSGGTVYSVYSFTGGTQAEWSWNFLGTIGYAYNNDVIEWSIPRALLGSSDIMRLEFHVVNGDVTVETWAEQSEANAKSYAFATANNCPSGIAPRLVPVSDQTIEANQQLSFTVRGNDPGCVPPTLTVNGKPAAATFNTSPSGTNQVGTFTWTPGGGDVGTYLIGFTAEDDQGYTATFAMRVYVSSPGEQTDGSGVPLSQTNWAVSIADIKVPSSGNVTLQWESVSGVPYDVYTASGTFGSGMSWTKVANAHEASGSMEDMAMTLNGTVNFVQVVPSGASPTLNGVWGLIKPAIVPGGGITLVSPPLQTDLDFQGELGAQVAASVSAGTKVMIMAPGASPTWTELTLNGSGDWIKTSGSGGFTLNPGQAFFLQTAGGESSLRIAGEVGNNSGHQNSLTVGYNLIGISEGKTLAASSAFENANPVGDISGDETLSDQIVIQRPNGSWRRLIRRSNGTWYDTDNPNSGSNTSLQLSPGAAYYYIRRSSGTTLTF